MDSYTLSYATFDGCFLLNADKLLEQADKRNWDASHWAKIANTFLLPRGMHPGRGFVLLPYGHARQLTTHTQTHQLEIVSEGAGTVANLVFLKYTCLYNGEPTTPDEYTPCLVEVADKRILLKMSSIIKGYNVPMAGMHGRKEGVAPNAIVDYDLKVENFYEESLKPGAGTDDPPVFWTWQTLLDNLWAALPSGVSVGTSPVLPYTPHGKPINFIFFGVSAWAAYHQVLAKIGCDLVWNPSAAQPATLVKLGATTNQDALEAVLDSKAARLVANSEATRNYTAEIPEKIQVLFRRQDEYYGEEKETIREDPNWLFNSVYKKEIATSLTNAVVGTKLILWDDLPAICKADGTIANETEITARATEIVANHKLALQRAGNWDRRMYRGILNIVPCETTSYVRLLFQGSDQYTELGQRIPAPGLAADYFVDFSPRESGGGGDTQANALKEIQPLRVLPIPHLADNLTPPDFGKFSYPQYPDKMQYVRLLDADELYIAGTKDEDASYPAHDGWVDPEPGEDPTEIKLYNAYVVRHTGEDLEEPETLELCWIYFSDGASGSTGKVYLARRCGSSFPKDFNTTVGNPVRPLYVVASSQGKPCGMTRGRVGTGKMLAAYGGTSTITYSSGDIVSNAGELLEAVGDTAIRVKRSGYVIVQHSCAVSHEVSTLKEIPFAEYRCQSKSTVKTYITLAGAKVVRTDRTTIAGHVQARIIKDANPNDAWHIGAITTTTETPLENGDFEIGDMSGWSIVGRVENVDGINYNNSSRKCMILSSSMVSPTTIRSALALAGPGYSGWNANTLTGNTNPLPLFFADGLGYETTSGVSTRGSVLYRGDLSALGGQTIYFEWCFATTQKNAGNPPTANFVDFAFVAVQRSTDAAPTIIRLADTTSASLDMSSPWSGAPFGGSGTTTGYASRSITLPGVGLGTYLLAFGVFDVGSTALQSGLMVDDVVFRETKTSGGQQVHASESILEVASGDEIAASVHGEFEDSGDTESTPTSFAVLYPTLTVSFVD